MKQYQYLYVIALLTYIAAKVSNYTGFLWGILSIVFWVLGIICACKNK